MKQINQYIDLQSLINYSKVLYGARRGEEIMNKRVEKFKTTPLSFYLQNPTEDTFKKVIYFLENSVSNHN